MTFRACKPSAVSWSTADTHETSTLVKTESIFFTQRPSCPRVLVCFCHCSSGVYLAEFHADGITRSLFFRIWIRLRCVNHQFIPLVANSGLFQKDLPVSYPFTCGRTLVAPGGLVALYLGNASQLLAFSPGKGQAAGDVPGAWLASAPLWPSLWT